MGSKLGGCVTERVRMQRSERRNTRGSELPYLLEFLCKVLRARHARVNDLLPSQGGDVALHVLLELLEAVA